MKLYPSTLVPVLLIMTAACVSRGSGGDTAAARDPNIITEDQIRQHNFNNAYDAVRALHPNWLTPRGVDSVNNPSIVLVYFDNARLGGVNNLRSIPQTSIAYIQFYNGTDASTRWGLDHGGGVIFVSSRPN